MAYTYFDPDSPDGVTQTGPEITPSIRANQSAIGDAVILGLLPFWDYAVTIGPIEAPAQWEYHSVDDPNQRIVIDATRDADGNPDTLSYRRTYDGTNYEPMGTKQISRATDGSVISITWEAV